MQSRNRKRNGKGSKKRIKEDHGAGFMGSLELLQKYLRDTPHSSLIGYTPKSPNKSKKDCKCTSKHKDTDDK